MSQPNGNPSYEELRAQRTDFFRRMWGSQPESAQSNAEAAGTQSNAEAAGTQSNAEAAATQSNAEAAATQSNAEAAATQSNAEAAATQSNAEAAATQSNAEAAATQSNAEAAATQSNAEAAATESNAETASSISALVPSREVMLVEEAAGKNRNVVQNIVFNYFSIGGSPSKQPEISSKILPIFQGLTQQCQGSSSSNGFPFGFNLGTTSESTTFPTSPAASMSSPPSSSSAIPSTSGIKSSPISFDSAIPSTSGIKSSPISFDSAIPSTSAGSKSSLISLDSAIPSTSAGSKSSLISLDSAIPSVSMGASISLETVDLTQEGEEEQRNGAKGNTPKPPSPDFAFLRDFDDDDDEDEDMFDDDFVPPRNVQPPSQPERPKRSLSLTPKASAQQDLRKLLASASSVHGAPKATSVATSSAAGGAFQRLPVSAPLASAAAAQAVFTPPAPQQPLPQLPAQDNLPPGFQCPVCLDAPFECRLTCGHIFCKNCIQSIMNRARPWRCPKCRRSFRRTYDIFA